MKIEWDYLDARLFDTQMQALEFARMQAPGRYEAQYKASMSAYVVAVYDRNNRFKGYVA